MTCNCDFDISTWTYETAWGDLDTKIRVRGVNVKHLAVKPK